MVANVLLVVGAFLLGSIPTAYLVGRYTAGIDIREYGSGNAGASNVIAHVGIWIGAAQGLFDCVVKGALPVLVAAYVIEVEFWIQGVAGIAAIAGHNWSPFLRFTGGRGVATAIGVMLGLTLWWELIIVAALFGVAVLASVLIKAVTRDTGLWTLVSILLLPVIAHFRDQPLEAVLTVVAIGVLMIAKRLTANWEPIPKQYGVLRVIAFRILWTGMSPREWNGRTGVLNEVIGQCHRLSTVSVTLRSKRAYPAVDAAIRYAPGA